MEIDVMIDNSDNYEERRSSAAGRLLDLLMDGEEHTNTDIAQPIYGGLQYNSAIYELRNRGWKIQKRHLGEGIWAYRLEGRGEPRDPGRMSGPQRRVAEAYHEAMFAVLESSDLVTVLSLVPPTYMLDEEALEERKEWWDLIRRVSSYRRVTRTEEN